MIVRNRIADVIKLRCNACQDFIAMILKPGWQQELYNKAQYEITNNTNYKSKYNPAYEKMREIGINNYSEKNMDVTLIAELFSFRFTGRNPVDKKTKDALMQLRNDRNTTDHSDENEEDEELYSRSLFALENLKNFIKAVDKYETSISDVKRLQYRQKYTSLIDTLKDKLDEERIELIQRKKQIEKDVKTILESNDPKKEWDNFYDYYCMQHSKGRQVPCFEDNIMTYYDFVVLASDSGIVDAHILAADYYISIKNYSEAERRLRMSYDSTTNYDKGYIHSFLGTVNTIIIRNNPITKGIIEMIDSFKTKGFNIEKKSNGLYALAK